MDKPNHEGMVHVVSDGTGISTKVFDRDGKEMQGITSAIWKCDAGGVATIDIKSLPASVDVWGKAVGAELSDPDELTVLKPDFLPLKPYLVLFKEAWTEYEETHYAAMAPSGRWFDINSSKEINKKLKAYRKLWE